MCTTPHDTDPPALFTLAGIDKTRNKSAFNDHNYLGVNFFHAVFDFGRN